MVLLVAAALAATIDVVYDDGRHAEETPPRRAPRVRRLRGRQHHPPDGLADRRPLESGGERRVATAVFVSFVANGGYDASSDPRPVAVAALFLLVLVTPGRPAPPPAPLALLSVRFGTSLAENG